MFEYRVQNTQALNRYADHHGLDYEQAHAKLIEGAGIYTRYRLLRDDRVVGYMVIDPAVDEFDDNSRQDAD